MKGRGLLWIVFIFILFHFLKDITQDVLKISSPFDLLGNTNEDISKFPLIARQGYLLLGYLSFIAEIFLLVTIPLVIISNNRPKLKKLVWKVILLFFLYLIFAILLDPRFKIL